MKKIFVLLLVIISIVFSQEREKHSMFRDGIYFEIYPQKISRDSLKINVFFRISVTNLVFEKSLNGVQNSFSVYCEVLDSINSQVVFRNKYSYKIELPSYADAKRRTNYFQNLFTFNVKNSKTILNLDIIEDNTENEVYKCKKNVNIDNIEKIQKPLFGNFSNGKFIIANYEGSLPYSSSLYDMIIPVNSANYDISELKIFDKSSKLIVLKPDTSLYTPLCFTYDNGNITISNNCAPKCKVYVFKSINQKLYEGPIRIFLDKENEFKSFVKWYNKPFSLLNLKYAIDKLELIAKKDEISKIRDADSTYDAFLIFWSKYNDNSKTKFNAIMEEFYHRVDYAIQYYSNLSEKDGSVTDMGKTYIIYGKPDETQRKYSPSKGTLEVWKYNKIKRNFIFQDKTGLGKYTLVE